MESESELFQHPHPAFVTGDAAAVMRQRHAAWMQRTAVRNNRAVFLEFMREHRISELSVRQVEIMRTQQCKAGLRRFLAALDKRYAKARKRRALEELDEEDWSFLRTEPELPSEPDEASTVE